MSDLVNEKERLLHIAFDRLSEEYPRGLYDWLYAHDRGVYDEIICLEDEINANFLNSGSISDLKTILREYWTVHMRAIKMFKSHSMPDTSLNEIRAERIKQRETAHL